MSFINNIWNETVGAKQGQAGIAEDYFELKK